MSRRFMVTLSDEDYARLEAEAERALLQVAVVARVLILKGLEKATIKRAQAERKGNGE